MHIGTNGWSEDAEQNRRIGIDYGRRALATAGEDPGALGNAATALATFGEDIGTMIGVLDRALALNPSFARGWYLSGGLKLFSGDPDGAIARLERSRSLSPRARIGAETSILGLAYLLRRQFDEAASTLLMAIQEMPDGPTAYRSLAACYAHMGRLAEAREIIERLRTLTPMHVPSFSYLRNPEHRELLSSGLRLAMGEEK